MAEREQEQSIKDRKRLLYEDDDPMPSSAGTVAGKPFAVHLRETPAAPLPTSIRAALWAAGVVVALLLAAAAYKSSRARPQADPSAPASRRAS